jgi:O-antigen/teichoic acid export membrane protein
LQIARLILTIKLIVGFSVAAVTLIFAEPLAVLLFHKPELTTVMPLIGFGLLSQMLFYFAFYYMQAHEKFVWWGSLLAGSNLLRLLLAFILLFLGRLNAYSATALWALVPLGGFLLGLFAIDKRVFTVKNYWSRLPEVFKFNKWVTSFSIVSAVSSRVDTYVTAQLVALSAVGVYGLGTQAVAYLPQIILALGAVTSPKFASFSDADHNHRYVRKTTYLSIGIALLAAIAMIPGGFVLFYLSGRQYTGGLTPYLVLLLSMLIFLITSPIRDSLLYFHNKPQFFLWAGIGQGIITIVTGIALIPRMGLLGSALSNLAGQLLLSTSAIVLFLRLNGNRKNVG